MSAETSLYLVAVALCIFCTALSSRARRGRPMTFFTGFLLIQSATFLCELLMAHPATPLKSLWLGLLMSGSLLLAPCLWLAFQETVAGTRPRLSLLPRWHWITVITGAACSLPLIADAHLGSTFYNSQQPIGHWHARFIHATMLMCISVFLVQVPWYLVRCRRILMARLAGRGSHWAELPLAIVFTTWLLAILRTLNCAVIKWPPMFSLVVAVISVSVTVGALYFLLRQFRPEEASPEPQRDPRPDQASYAKSALGEAPRARIRRKLEATLGHIYKRSDLSLRTLSETLNESPHYVSQVISQDLNTSFYELVNGYRIAEAKRLLQAAPDETVLAIAMNVGFNSKSAFHNAFRRSTGITPTEFRQAPAHPQLN
jgi:AraC-like DNA-binding protein